jgi:hypothetical protein
MQTMTTDDDRLRRKIKTNAIILGFVAFGFFIAFIAFTAIVRG